MFPAVFHKQSQWENQQEGAYAPIRFLSPCGHSIVHPPCSKVPWVSQRGGGVISDVPYEPPTNKVNGKTSWKSLLLTIAFLPACGRTVSLFR